MNLALFDFDGTISTRDSYLLFTEFLNRKRYIIGCLILAPRIIGYLARIYPNYALKEDFLRFFYRGRTTDELQVQTHRFCSRIIPGIIRPGAMERIKWHQAQGDTIVVISACPRLILEPWCHQINADIIATELETDQDSRITGKIAGKNCWGQEKVRRIQSRYTLHQYDGIFAYGDSKGDLPMLELADTDKRFYKPFR
jgi:phosphatidylglycerophosphatase C